MLLLKRFYKNFALLLISLVTIFSLIEISLRIIPDFKRPSRFLMWSLPLFEIDSYGAVTFAKNESIREVAVYNGIIEYDVVYNTNNLGSVDRMNYERNIDKGSMGSRYAFVGDSFAVGSGGYPWVPRLRDKVLSYKKDMQIYSFGIPGGGPWHFLKIIESASRNIEFTDIVILAVSDDMFRPYFIPIVENDRVYFCPHGTTHREAWVPIATIIDKNATKNEILNRVKSLVPHKIEPRKTFSKNIMFFFKKSLFLKLIKKNLDRFISKPVHTSNIDYTPLVKIRALFPKARIYFIHLPLKNEARDGRYILDLKDTIESLGIKYYPALTEWKWSMAMYHKYDGHPNKLGYANISNCVEKYLI
jgi:hypothetical protein